MASDNSKRSEPGSKLPVKAETPSSAGHDFAADLRGFGPIGLLVILVIILSGNVFLGNFLIPLGAMLVLLWVRLSHTPWHEIGYVRPKSWIGSVVLGLVFGIAFKFLMKAIVMPLFGADPINQTYHHLAGNSDALPAAIWSMVVAGFAEETVWRGFLFERLGKLLGTGIWAKIFIVVLTSGVFALFHFTDQGLAGAEQATITGLMFGTIFAGTGRIFMVMVIHSAFDLTALAFIYTNLEYNVAHLFFK